MIAVGEAALPYIQATRAAGVAWHSPTSPPSTASSTSSRPGDAILVKASRAVGLEGIPASIEKRARAWSES